MLLMDEPFSGLDVQLRDSMQDETLTLLKETRTTAVIVTHHPEEAMRLADRIAVMRAGKVVQHGGAQDLYLAPKDLFVARLFSEINEIPATVKEGRIDTAFGTFAAPGLAEGSRAILCVRQRGVRLRAPGEGVEARVVDVRFMGDAARIEIAVQGLETRLRVRSEVGQKFAKGEEVSVKVDSAETLVFSADEEDF
jgi:iron(III) transport system ATP-binding protein